MNPLRALTFGLFLLLLAACEDNGTDAPVLPYPGTYDAIVLYNNGDTLELVLEFPDQYIKVIHSPNRPELVVGREHIYSIYHSDTKKGNIAIHGTSTVSIYYSYTFDGNTMSGPMQLKFNKTLPRIDIDTTVRFVRR